MNRILHAILIAAAIIFSSCAAPEKSKEKLPYTVGEILLSDDFSGNSATWEAEGQSPELVDGKMVIDTNSFAAVWLKPALLGNIVIEYDVTVLSQNSSDKTQCSFGCFAMASDPADTKNFFAGSKERAGTLSGYDNLNLYYYYLSCDSKNSAKFMKYSNGKHESIGTSAESSYKISPDKKYHVKLLFFKNTIEFYLNDRRLLKYEGSSPYTEGNFGFTALVCKIAVDNFSITHLRQFK